MILLRQKIYSTQITHKKLYREWKKTRDPETAYRWSQAWGEEVYEKTREEDLGNLKPDPKAMKAADDYVRSQDPKNYAKMKRLNKDLEDAYKGGNPTTIENARNAINTWVKKNSRKTNKPAQKEFAAISKSGKVVMPSKIALDLVRKDDTIKKLKRPGESNVQLAKRLLDAAKKMSDTEDGKKVLPDYIVNRRQKIGFHKGIIESPSCLEHASWTRIGFKPDWTEPTGQKIKLGFKKFSKQDREVVPDDIAEEGKKSVVIQKDKNGNWRIISYKTKTNKSGKPEFWDAKYESKEAAEKALGGYFANKRR